MRLFIKLVLLLLWTATANGEGSIAHVKPESIIPGTDRTIIKTTNPDISVGIEKSKGIKKSKFAKQDSICFLIYVKKEFNESKSLSGQLILNVDNEVLFRARIRRIDTSYILGNEYDKEKFPLYEFNLLPKAIGESRFLLSSEKNDNLYEIKISDFIDALKSQ